MSDNNNKYDGLSRDELIAIIQERDAAIQERDAAIRERDAAIQERDAAIQGRQVKILSKRALQTCASDYLRMKHLYSM
jgi:uncharacterized protein (DUF3084 family)